MKRIFIITALLFLTTLSVHSQGSEKDLDEIRDWFKEVNSNISQYRKVEFPNVQINEDLSPDQNSIEGAEIYRLGKVNMTKFFEGDQLVKIILQFYGDREELTSEYYFKKGDLFFVDKIKTIYHRPKWDDEFKETENSVSKNRFYFNNNQLIRWINPEIKTVGRMDPSFKDNESKILSDYSLYLRIN